MQARPGGAHVAQADRLCACRGFNADGRLHLGLGRLLLRGQAPVEFGGLTGLQRLKLGRRGLDLEAGRGQGRRDIERRARGNEAVRFRRLADGFGEARWQDKGDIGLLSAFRLSRRAQLRSVTQRLARLGEERLQLRAVIIVFRNRGAFERGPRQLFRLGRRSRRLPHDGGLLRGDVLSGRLGALDRGGRPRRQIALRLPDGS